ncbi:MAG: hypothetical protein KAQ87_02715 [Candidatus Pacebacteria bacterium]|nr:hypothetical protein [Candidatus Paceibacterota bacterium]
MQKIYKCAKNCGNIEKVEKDNSRIPICCGVAMTEVKKDASASLGCFGCMGCYGGFEEEN